MDNKKNNQQLLHFMPNLSIHQEHSLNKSDDSLK